MKRLTKRHFGPRRKRARNSAFHYGRLGGLQLELLEERALLAALTVDIAEASISENGGVASAIVSRDAGSNGDLVVNLTSSNTDEATVPLTATIPDGQDSASFTITGVDEQIVDLAKTITISASADTFDHGSDTIDVTNDDSATLSVGDATVVEGDEGTAVLSFPVTLNSPVDVDVSVDYTTQDGSASAADDDYVAVTTPATLTIKAGDTSGIINITVNADTTVERDETVNLLLSNLQAGRRNLSLGLNWAQLGPAIEGNRPISFAGNSVSISDDGNTVVIGSGNNRVRVYRLDGTDWILNGQDVDGVEDGRAGVSLSLSGDGNTLAIGSDGTGDFSGRVRIYRFDGVNWTQLGQSLNGESANDGFGGSVSLSDDGDTVAIGAPSDGTDSGQVTVYRFVGIGWIQLGQDIDGEFTQDYFGDAVSLSGDGNTLVVGALTNDGNGKSSGHVRAYRFNGINWLQLGQDIDGEDAGDRSGTSVSASYDGSTVVIGAPLNDGNGNASGHARVYRFDDANWIQIGEDINGEAVGNQSGYSVSLSRDGNTVVIGAYHNDDNGINSGQARVYRFVSGDWTQFGQDFDGETARDLFGNSVSLSGNGNTFVVGAPLSDGNIHGHSGQARVYRLQHRATGTITDDDSLLVEFSQTTGLDAESSGENLPQLWVTGSTQGVDGVRIDVPVVGGTATGDGVDYTGPITMAIFAGTYNATSVAIRHLVIVPDMLIEADETIELELLPGSQFAVGDANGDGIIQATTLYTIQDDDLQNVRTAVELDNASILTIRDFVLDGKDDQLELTIVDDRLVITDRNNALGNFGDNTTGNEVSVLLTALQSIEIDLAAGDDQVSIDFSNAPQDLNLSVAIRGGDGHDTLTFSGQNVLGAGELRTNDEVEDIFVNGSIAMQRGSIMLNAAQSLEINADINFGSGSVELMAGRDIFGNCSLIQAGDADVQLISGTGIGNVRVQTTGDVSLNSGSGGIIGCAGEISVRAETLTLVSDSSVGSALMTGGQITNEAPLLTSVDAIQGTVGGLGIFLENDRPLTDNVELTGDAPMGVRRVCDPTTCKGSEGEGSPLHNAANQLDVNNDGLVSPIDALAVVNYLNSTGTGAMAEAPSDDLPPVPLGERDLHFLYVDVNGDRSASALDALIIINYLNRRTVVQPEGESARTSPAANHDSEQYELAESAALVRTVPFPPTPSFLQATSSRRTRSMQTASKDDEVGRQWETLLDELAEDATDALLAQR